ncbi:Dual specificity protein kinase splB [Dirofilaria immitis]
MLMLWSAAIYTFEVGHSWFSFYLCDRTDSVISGSKSSNQLLVFANIPVGRSVLSKEVEEWQGRSIDRPFYLSLLNKIWFKDYFRRVAARDRKRT